MAFSPPDVVDRGAEVMGPVSKSTVQAVFRAVALCVGLMDADPGLVVAEVVAALRVPRGPVQERAPATQWGCVSLCLPRRSGLPALPFPCRVCLGKSLAFSVPPFLISSDNHRGIVIVPLS